MARVPVNLTLHTQSKQLELDYGNGESYALSCELLRVYSPSAEVQGHGPGEEVLQTGKRHANIDKIEPQGNFAIRLHFSDGHNTGIYSWDFLERICQQQESMWQDYLQRLHDAGASRDPDVSVVKLMDPR